MSFKNPLKTLDQVLETIKKATISPSPYEGEGRGEVKKLNQ